MMYIVTVYSQYILTVYSQYIVTVYSQYIVTVYSQYINIIVIFVVIILRCKTTDNLVTCHVMWS